MNSSKEHKNWITIGEIIKLIKTPVELYTDSIVKRWHLQLLSLCSAYGHCTSPANCRLEKKPKNLCRSCNGWYLNLESSHLNTNKSQIRWRPNCDTSLWPLDAWEMAKFFMSPLGDNKSTVKDAKSTDLSSLLNVLEWMGNVSFCGHTRVDRGLVQLLRSEVRNSWAHAPSQEMTTHQLNNAFDLAKKFLDDLEKVFTDGAVKKCREDIKWLQKNGVTNVAEAELNNLLLLRRELGQEVNVVKEDINSLKEDKNSDRQRIEEQERKVQDLEDYKRQCCKKMEEFQQSKEHVDKEIKALQDQAGSSQGNKSFQIGSYIPEKLQTFTGRDKEMAEILSSLDKKESEGSPGIVAIIGGPGFGKSTIAIEVSHRIKEKNIPVIFSYLSNAFTVDAVIRRLCLDLGIDLGSSSVHPMSSLTFWLKNIEERVVLVMDNIEQLQQSKEDKELNNLLRSLRKDSKNLLQILVTSTTSLKIPDLATKQCSVNVMELESSIKLLKKCCPDKEIEQHHLQEMAELCGHVPLALRLVAFRLETDDPEELITWLKDVPMEALETPNVDAKVKNTIKKSFEMLEGKEKKSFVRLAIFPGNFDRKAASYVTELGGLQTSNTLTLLLRRSLLQQNGYKCMMHRLIRCFLIDESKGFQVERAETKRLMLEYYLKKCEELTKLYWRKDGYKKARSAMKEDSHNIEEVLKFCEEAVGEGNTKMVDVLVKSDIYKSLSRFFCWSVRTVLSYTLVRNFLGSCLDVAEAKGDIAAVINFQCLVAHKVGVIFGRKSEEYKKSMASARERFEGNKEKLKNNNDVKCCFYYYYGQYLYNTAIFSEAEEYFRKCYRIVNGENPTTMDKVDQVFVLMGLGLAVNHGGDELRNAADVESLLTKAITLSEECLGCHELTAICYQVLGGVVYMMDKMVEAVKCSREALEIYHKLGMTYNRINGLYLLYQLGDSLWKLDQKHEASPYLKEAFALFDKISSADQQRQFCDEYGDIRKRKEEYENWERTTQPAKERETNVESTSTGCCTLQ